METSSNKNEIINTISTEQNQIDNSNPVEEKTIQNVDIIREQYVPTSEVCDTAQTVAPVRMLYEINKNLREIDRRVRGIDAFVANELGYKDMISLCNAFNGEQVDAIAVAINQIQKGKAVIIGDSTGIGKGRICAAILLYAKRKGKKPIFITEKPNLFSDIYRDIIAVGMDDGVPLKFKGEEVEKTQQVNREFIIKAMKQDIQENVFDLEGFDSDRLFKKGEKQYTEDAILKYREEYFPDQTIKIFQYNKNKNYEQDIDGAKRFVPFIVNGRSLKTDIKDINGNIIYSGLANDKHKEILKSLSLQSEYDCVLATYSQFSSGRLADKINFVSTIADGNIIVMDECHNASGSSARGEYLTEIAERTEAIVFASATYAKRPDNMPIYAVKTNISDAELSKDDLITAIQRGGVAMQEILSSQLVSEGQMIRRERGYEGIDVNYITLDESCESTNPDFNLKNSHYGIVDKFVSVIREIITFVEKDINPIIEEKRISHIENQCDSFLANAILNGSKIERDEAREQCEADMYNSSPYAGIFTIIGQMYFSLKAEAVAEWAIHRMKQGKKPVIALASTMESILDYAIEESSGVKVDVDFAIVLKRRLAKSLEYTTISYDGNIEKLSLNEDDLSGDALYNYERISEMIDNIVTGITISPIDFIEKRISEAGFSVEEVTGRNRVVEFDKFEETGYVKNRNVPNASDVFRRFNNNETDCIIINQAGSTGASAHAIKTESVKKVSYQNDIPIVPTSLDDKSEIKQRVMIILQAEGDVNKEVQKRGRIFRTGQVFSPIYDYIISAIPSEKRLMMMLRNKLRSLDANTSSNQKQSNEILNVVDFLNQYGDDVVAQFLVNNPEINEKIGHPVSFSEIYKDDSVEYVPNEKIDDLAHMVTGRISILNTDEQEYFYNEVIESYKSYESKLTQEGKWNLGVDSLDLQAEVIEKDAISIGNPEKKSVFGGATFVELCDVNNIRKPFTKKYLIGLYDSILSSKDSKGNYVEINVDEYITNINSTIDERAKNEYEHFKPIYEKSKRRELESLSNQNAIRKIKNEQKRQDAIISETKKITEIWDSKISGLEDIFKRAEKFKKIVSFFSPKKIVSYNIQNKNFDGLAIGVKITDGAWLSANHLHLKIAFPSTLRQMELSFSSISEIDKIINNTLKVYNESQRDIVGKYLYNDWDEKIRELSSDRVKRYIVTGNILKAYGVQELSNSANRLISYSTSDKKVKKGILLPDDFDPNDLTIKIPMESAKSIAVNSIGGGYKSLSFGDDGVVYIIPKSNMLILRRQKTKRRLYHIDKDNQLAEYLDTNWISSREFYETEITGKDNVEKVIEHLYKKGIPMNLPFREFKEISKNYDTKDRFTEEDAISEIIRKYNESLELYEKEQDKNFIEASAVDIKRFNEIQKELYELKREKAENGVLRFFVETIKFAQKRKENEVMAMRDGGSVTIAEIQENESFKLISDEVEINEILSHFNPKFDDIDEMTKQPYSANIGGVFVRYENGDIAQVLAFEGLPDIQKPIFEIYPTNEYF